MYNIVDRIYIGHIPGHGDIALTGVGVTFPIIMLISAFSAFAGMGGLSSFAMTMLDRNDSGILLNCIHSRESCYTYIKEITQGECDKALSKEEAKCLEEAKNKH